ncbi:thioredoxin-domain-containing protein [Piedraia hortae CBS 480.64]|uniref:Thioredoxin-domain-containing protein n=1 Tax=Piedraia hortae CBS 480.64 TaxID=1314780 RepID=A0A6A7C4E8_9PEZI|nr:thioredoxin-domain-containing protein [Piedraia hortae CBS 480.64]
MSLLLRTFPVITSRSLLSTRPLTRTFRMSSHASADNASIGVHNLTSKKDFDEALAVKGSLMVVDFFATWCGPCKVIAPQVVEMSNRFKNARFYKIDVDELPAVAQELGITAMPTFVLFKDGEKVQDVVGARTAVLEKAIQTHCN